MKNNSKKKPSTYSLNTNTTVKLNKNEDSCTNLACTPVLMKCRDMNKKLTCCQRVKQTRDDRLLTTQSINTFHCQT